MTTARRKLRQNHVRRGQTVPTVEPKPADTATDQTADQAGFNAVFNEDGSKVLNPETGNYVSVKWAKQRGII